MSAVIETKRANWPPPPADALPRNAVVITDIQVPFGSVIALVLKATLALIPVALVITVCVMFIALWFGVMLRLA